MLVGWINRREPIISCWVRFTSPNLLFKCYINNSTMEKTIKNGTEWTVRDGYENIPDMFNPDDFLSNLNGKRYTLVKENRVRSVISMPASGINANGIYIKYFKRGGFKEYIKHLFVPTKARTEWEVGNALRSNDIKTALPLAISEGKRGLLMVTETVTNSEELMEFFTANYVSFLSEGKEFEKRMLLNKLAVFIRDIHEKGFCHYDLHAGNILIKFNKEQNVTGYDLYLMDLHRVKIFKSVSTNKRIFNLAQIFNSLSSIMTMSDKFDFIRSYGDSAFGNVTDEKELVRQIDEQSSKIRNIHYRSRRKRCLKESSVFSRRMIANMKMFFRKGYDTDSLHELIEKHNSALINNDSAVIMKCDSKTALTRHAFKDKTVQNVVVKQYRVGCFGCLLKNLFRGSAGRKAWVAGNGLRVYGLNTPLPLALLEKKRSGITTGSYLIMEEVKDSLEMDRYILKNLDNRKDIKKKKALISNIANTLGEMHNHNIFHHDLKTCNIMVKENGKSFDFTFLDFDKVSFNEEITVRKRVKNLVQINLSTPRLFTLTDRLRFLNEYLDLCGITNEKKNMMKEVASLSKTEKILYVSSQGDVTEDW